MINSIIANISANMEVKSSMGTIVAIPTAGSCGTFGGTIKAYCDSMNIPHSKKIRAYFAGGLIGVFFAEGPGFSAEKYGCQVETGIASAMTAAALVELSGGSAKQSIAAASMAMQNLIGLVCDPIADRVEVPCLGKNISAAMNALSSHIMALSGFDQVIPLDEVIKTVEAVGNLLPASLRCTGKGGLAVTETSKTLKKSLNNQKTTQIK
jgi:L-serine dehydratase